MRIQQAIQSLVRRHRTRIDTYLFITILVTSLCVRFGIGPQELMLPIALVCLVTSFPLGLFRIWQQWQHYKAWVASREARLRAHMAAFPKPLGDPNCVHSARSPYIRCGINPEGPCEECADFKRLNP